MNHAHEQDETGVQVIEDALVMGNLMAVDWTNKIARLERFREKPIKLRFGKELDEDMRRFATHYVQIEGKGYLKRDIERWASIDVERVSLPYEGNEPKIFRSADSALLESPFESNEELQDFIQIIREGRHV